jgi:hypothetical protein
MNYARYIPLAALLHEVGYYCADGMAIMSAQAAARRPMARSNTP